MRASVSKRVQIKAAHGVRSAGALLEALQAGATRVGATHTAAMLDEWAAEQRRYAEQK
jgi:deoxyribose-phosphate aldolase